MPPKRIRTALLTTLLLWSFPPVSYGWEGSLIQKSLNILTFGLAGSAEESAGESKSRNPTDPAAQYLLGVNYLNGQGGVTADPQQALRWFTQAAEQGHAKAQTSLGKLYATGKGVAQNDQQATHWYQKAAQQGYAEAQILLGSRYEQGKGVAQDPQQAAHWYLQAAQQNNAVAQVIVGLLYAQGRGVTQDPQQAVHWFTQAANQGDVDAQNNLGVMYAQGKGVALDLKQAVNWFTQAAEQGNTDAQYNLGAHYAEGKGVSRDPKQAVRWLTAAAKQGHADAQYHLGLHSAQGEGVALNDQQALHWFTQAAEQGHAAAQFQLARRALEGREGTLNTALALQWLQKAAAQNHAEAQRWLPLVLPRGRLKQGITLRSHGRTRLLSPPTYVIARPNGKELIYPESGEILSTAALSLSEGTELQIAVQEVATATPTDLATLNLTLTTDFLLQSLEINGATLPLESVAPATQPEWIETHTSIDLDRHELTRGVNLNLLSREGNRHTRRLQLHEGQFQIVSPNEMMLK